MSEWRDITRGVTAGFVTQAQPNQKWVFWVAHFDRKLIKTFNAKAFPDDAKFMAHAAKLRRDEGEKGFAFIHFTREGKKIYLYDMSPSIFANVAIQLDDNGVSQFQAILYNTKTFDVDIDVTARRLPDGTLGLSSMDETGQLQTAFNILPAAFREFNGQNTELGCSTTVLDMGQPTNDRDFKNVLAMLGQQSNFTNQLLEMQTRVKRVRTPSGACLIHQTFSKK